jgi:hypothetical protein
VKLIDVASRLGIVGGVARPAGDITHAEMWNVIDKLVAAATQPASPEATKAGEGEPMHATANAPDGFYSPTDIAKAMNVPDKTDAIRMAIKRLFDENRLPGGAWMENNNPANGQAKILYRLPSVRPLLARFEPS